MASVDRRLVQQRPDAAAARGYDGRRDEPAPCPKPLGVQLFRVQLGSHPGQGARPPDRRLSGRTDHDGAAQHGMAVVRVQSTRRLHRGHPQPAVRRLHRPRLDVAQPASGGQPLEHRPTAPTGPTARCSTGTTRRRGCSAQNAGHGIGRCRSGDGITGLSSSATALRRSASTSRPVMCSRNCSPSVPRTSSRSRRDRLQRLVVDGLARPSPQHGAQLVLDVQAHAVVDAVDMAVDRGQDVAALAVGVVDQHVEHRHPAQPDVVGVHQGHLVTRVVVGAQHRQESGRNVARREADPPDRARISGSSPAPVVAGLVHPQLQHARCPRARRE